MLLGLLLATTLAAAANWSRVPGYAGSSLQQDCSSCHAGSVPPTHSRNFVEREHGAAARMNRQECLGCHENAKESCAPCHQKQPPTWHTDDFRNPGLGTPEMREHIRIAGKHRESCNECHATTYMDGCADCHRPEEEWLGRAAAALEDR
jgi:hypothetical protein